MPKQATAFQEIIKKLKALYGPPRPPKTTEPLEMILLENVAYLVGDEQREEAFDALRDRVGLSPVDIVTARDEKLLEVARIGGMLPAVRVEKLRRIANIALQEFDGDLNSVLSLPMPKAKRALKKFPGIGDPGAERILPLHSNPPAACARIEWLACDAAAGLRRRAKELLGDLSFGTGGGGTGIKERF